MMINHTTTKDINPELTVKKFLRLSTGNLLRHKISRLLLIVLLADDFLLTMLSWMKNKVPACSLMVLLGQIYNFFLL